MIDALAELREAILTDRKDADENSSVDLDGWYACLGLLDHFAAAHPGLVDLTLCGPQCPAYGVAGQRNHKDRCWVSGDMYRTDAPTGQPCPVLAARNLTKSQVRRIAEQMPSRWSANQPEREGEE
jgi:hypothetical protein